MLSINFTQRNRLKMSQTSNNYYRIKSSNFQRQYVLSTGGACVALADWQFQVVKKSVRGMNSFNPTVVLTISSPQSSFITNKRNHHAPSHCIVSRNFIFSHGSHNSGGTSFTSISFERRTSTFFGYSGPVR